MHTLQGVEGDGAGIGAELKRARIARKRSIEEVARSTKINASILRAIENEEFAKLPGGLFSRGFLRAYAREVGLDPEQIVERFRTEFEGEITPPPETAQPEEQPISKVRPSVVVDEETASSRRIQLLQLFVIVLIVALYFALSRRPRTDLAADADTVTPVAEAPKAQTPNPAPPNAAPPNAAPNAAAPKPDTPVATNGMVPDSPPKSVTLELHPNGPCWVEATADGQRLYASLMDAGQTASVPVNKDVTLRVGDPGTLAFTIDGAPGKSLGPAGQPVTIHINRENYKTFLESQPQG